MDIFAHGLWSGAAAKALNNKTEKSGIGKKLSMWQTVFWGVMPDLFAFTIPFIAIIWGLMLGTVNLSDLHRVDTGEPPPTDTLWFLNLANSLYNISHSLIVFSLVFILVWILMKKPYLEFGAWVLHILIDIPTHSYKFFPTPFLWPVSSFKFNGFSWADSWFMMLNYSAIIVVYLLLYRKKISKKTQK